MGIGRYVFKALGLSTKTTVLRLTRSGFFVPIFQTVFIYFLLRIRASYGAWVITANADKINKAGGFMSKAECRYDENDDLIVSSTDIMKIFNIGQRTCAEWAKMGCPKVGRGEWKLKDVVKWRGLLRLGDATNQESDAAKKLRADAEYKDAKAKQEAVRLQEMLGNLVPIEMIQEQWAFAFADIRQQLLKLPNDIRARIHTSYPECSEDVSLIAEEIIRRTLEGLSECGDAGLTKPVEEVDSGDDSEG